MIFPSQLAISAPRSAHFLIGTYTSPKGSKGVYRATLNTLTGRVSQLKLAVEADNPSYVAVHPSGKFLYAVHENDHGSVSAYAVGRHRTLTLLNTQLFTGPAACHLSVDRRGKHLFVASYTGGYITCLPILPHGSLGPPSSVIHQIGTGPNKDRQDGAHAHWVSQDPAGRFIYTCDLGTDKVQTYRLRDSKLVEVATATVTPGDGPRHGTLSRNRKHLYVNTEMGCTVTVFNVDRQSGALRKIQEIGTVHEGDHKPENTTAEIECHPNGKFLYVSNRGDDSIAVFRIGHAGRLKLVQIEKLKVVEPRGFQIEPSGRWLLVGGQKSDNLQTLRIDRHSGRLRSARLAGGVSKPVCILFTR